MHLDPNQISIPQNFPAAEKTSETIQTTFGAVRLEKISDGFWEASFGNIFKYGKTRDEALNSITKQAKNALQIRLENY